MIYLLCSIVLVSYLTLSFKVLQKLNINSFQSIVFNYIACVITGTLVNGSFPINAQNIRQPWFVWAVVMGFLFVSILNIVGFATQKLGVAIASVANKLSLVIPFIFSIYLYNEKVSILKIVGIIIALTSIILTCYPQRKNISTNKKIDNLLFIVPLVLFVSSGFLDTLLVFVKNKYFINPADNFNNFLISAFTIAGFVGVIILVSQFITRKQNFNIKALIAGFIIGIPNYFSIWFLGKVISEYKGYSSAIIPVNNMGVVLFSTVVAWLLFKEKLSIINWFGIALAICAIALIAYG